MSGKLFIAIGALYALLGVGFAAAAAHVTGGSLKTAADFLLWHGLALLVIVALNKLDLLQAGFALASLCLLALGVFLFSGDLAMRSFFEMTLWAKLAPIGGSLIMVGWLSLILAGLTK